MTTNNVKRPPMPREIALEFVRATMEPYNGSWSGMWLWEQPDDEDVVHVSGVYGSPPSHFSVKDIIGEPENPGDEAEIARRAKDQLDLVNLANRLWGDGEDDADTNYGYLDFTYDPDTSDIIVSRDFLVPFNRMDLIDRVKYRFAMMFVNGPREGHNWACEFLEELGCKYFDLAIDPVAWEGHDCDRDLSDFMDEVRERGYVFPGVRDRNFTASEFVSEYDEETVEWLIDRYTQSPLFPIEFWKGNGESVNEILGLLAYAIEYVQEQWEDGNLLLGEGAPKPIRDWMNENGIQSEKIEKTIYDAIRDGSLWEDNDGGSTA